MTRLLLGLALLGLLTGCAPRTATLQPVLPTPITDPLPDDQGRGQICLRVAVELLDRVYGYPWRCLTLDRLRELVPDP
jgi:hypothetical protein